MKLTFDQLCALHDRLSDRLCGGEIQVQGYLDEWDALVSFAGWTMQEVIDEIDLHWDTNKKGSATLFRS